MTFLSVVLGIIFLVTVFGLNRRVTKLESEVTMLRNVAQTFKSEKIGTSSYPIQAPTQVAVSSIPSPIPIPVPLATPIPETAFTPRQVVHEPTEFFLYTWFKEHTLIKIGGMFFFLGAVWFVSYAINVGWISPELRILFGFLLAILAYILGYYRQKTSIEQCVILTALGTGILCATVTAAQLVFAMLAPVLALGLLALALAYTTFVAFTTKTDWLVLLSAVLALVVPQLVGEFGSIVPILMYITLVTIGLLAASLLLTVRATAALLSVGILFYELRFLPEASANTLWFFVVLLAAVVFAGVSALLSRTDTVHAFDVFTLFITGLGFIFFASKIALSATLALFIATFVIGMTGYVFAERRASLPVVSLFVALASIGLLVATSFLFSGFTLILAYIIESTIAFLLVTHLGLPKRVVYMVALTYLLPLLGSLAFLGSTSWETGIWHTDGLVVYAMSAALMITTLWLVHHKAVSVYTWSRSLALTFGVTGFFYVYAVCGVVAHALFIEPDASVITYIMWAVVSLLTVHYAFRQPFPLLVPLYASLTLIFPILASVSSFTSNAWSLGVQHIEGYGVMTILLVMVLMTLLLLQRFCKEYDATLLSVITGFVISTVAYLFAIFFVLWNGLLIPAEATIAIYVSYAVTLYGLIALFTALRTRTSWISSAVAAFSLPVIMSLSSFSLEGYAAGVLVPEVVGIFSIIVLAVMIAFGLRNHYTPADDESKLVIKKIIRGFLVLAFLYTVGLTWSLAHTIVAPDQAVSLALFIYTVSGLAAYHFGNQYQKSDWRFAGIALLAIVVLRLLLVDVWEMELMYRFITFLGVGALFIGTALFEKRPPSKN